MLVRLFCFLSLVSGAVAVRAAPLIEVSPLVGEVRVRQVAYSRVSPLEVSAFEVQRETGAVGRIYEILTAGELAALSPLEPFTPEGELQVRRGDFFDLWAAFPPGTVTDARTALRLHVEFQGAANEAAFLLLGGNDGCAVYADGAPLWGTHGAREHLDGENVVRIPLDSSGRGRIDVLSWRNASWATVPPDHIVEEWSLNLAVCPDETRAWQSIARRKSHFLDTPIVATAADLRSTFHFDGHAGIEFYDLHGQQVARGCTTAAGRVELFDPLPFQSKPFVGIAVLGGELAEAIVLTNGTSLDDLWDPCLQSSGRLVPGWTAWAYRCRHLFKEEFRKDRDHRWARKAAVTIAMAGLRTSFDRTRTPFRQWTTARLEWGDYESRIDGTKQFYRAMVQSPEQSETRPLLVVLPGVPLPVRPFLESYMAADMQGAEELASLASAAGCDVLWPGVVDIDYGGHLTRAWVQETIAAFEAAHPVAQRSIYLVGTCAAGASAVGYAETYGGVDGLVLWSPVVDRPNYRWPSREPAGWPMHPRDVMREESAMTGMRKLRSVPAFVLFDHDEPGHGDRPGTAALCRELQAIGGHVDEEWVDRPDHHMVWGMRAAVGQRRWVEWVTEQARNGSRLAMRKSLGAAAQTIKSALIRGYRIEPPSEPIARSWLANWYGELRKYRGEPNPRGASLERASSVEVKVHALRDFVRRIEAGFGYRRPVLPQFSSLAECASAYDILFGIRFEPGEPDRVEVWLDERTPVDRLPPADLFREGCCEAALWGWRNGRWESIQVWL